MIEIYPVTGIGEIGPGADLATALIRALEQQLLALRSGDVMVVSQKIVSKSEGRLLDLASVQPGDRASELAQVVGKDPRLVEAILAESVAIVRATDRVLITRHRTGHVMANAGIDRSNLGREDEDLVLLLPLDPDVSADRLRAVLEQRFAVEIGVIVSDSFGRPWRQGVVNVAIGCSGAPALVDLRGVADRDGRPLEATLVGLADLLASAAGLAMGEAADGIPAVLVRGLHLAGHSRAAKDLVRPLDEDLFT